MKLFDKDGFFMGFLKGMGIALIIIAFIYLGVGIYEYILSL